MTAPIVGENSIGTVPSGREKELVTTMLSQFIQMLDEELASSRAVFPDTQDYERETAI